MQQYSAKLQQVDETTTLMLQKADIQIQRLNIVQNYFDQLLKQPISYSPLLNPNNQDLFNIDVNQPDYMTNVQLLEKSRKSQEKWTDEEHNRFLRAYMQFGRNSSQKIAQQLPGRDSKQIASHQQKFLKKITNIEYEIKHRGSQVYVFDKTQCFPLELLVSTVKYINIIESHNDYSYFGFVMNLKDFEQYGVQFNNNIAPQLSKQFCTLFGKIVVVERQQIIMLHNNLSNNYGFQQQFEKVYMQIQQIFTSIVDSGEPYFYATYHISQLMQLKLDFVSTVIFYLFYVN